MILGIIYKLKKIAPLAYDDRWDQVIFFFPGGVHLKPLEPNCTPVVLLNFQGHNEKYTQVRQFSQKVGRHTQSSGLIIHQEPAIRI